MGGYGVRELERASARVSMRKSNGRAEGGRARESNRLPRPEEQRSRSFATLCTPWHTPSLAVGSEREEAIGCLVRLSLESEGRLLALLYRNASPPMPRLGPYGGAAAGLT